MKTKTLQQIARAVEGQLYAIDPALTVDSICTDTRRINPGCLFMALKGENHDGHDHVQAAKDSGASAVMVSRKLPIDIPQIVVSETKIAMGQLGNYTRHLLRGAVIAVGGSNGKTGTKHLIDSVLEQSLTGTISPKSFNNDIGVPTTIFDAVPTDDYLVLEIGTNHHGEIFNLTMIAQPDIAVITNIGAEHLEFLGDLDGVIRENAQMIAGLNPEGLLILNGDNPALLRATESYPGKKITFGLGTHNDLFPTDIRCGTDGVRFRLNDREIFIPLMGRHTAVNALAAIAVGRHLQLSEDEILTGLAHATGAEMRLQLQSAGSVKILNDAYNANPHSMTAGLETLRDMQTPGRRVAILGDMKELGATADFFHREAGTFAATCELDSLICVGEKAALIADAAVSAGMEVDQVQHFANSSQCAAAIASIITQNDLVLLKASRSMRLETIGQAIMTAAAGDALRREVAARAKRVVMSPEKITATR